MPRGVDWIAARDFWLESGPPRSFGVVARAFGVSDTRVRVVARRDGWQQLAEEIDAAELERAKRRIVRSREERHQRIRELTDAMLDDLDGRTHEAKWSDAPAWLRHLELIEGEATDRVSFGELQEALVVVVDTLMPFVAKERRQEALAAVRQRLGAVSSRDEGAAA